MLIRRPLRSKSSNGANLGGSSVERLDAGEEVLKTLGIVEAGGRCNQREVNLVECEPCVLTTASDTDGKVN